MTIEDAHNNVEATGPSALKAELALSSTAKVGPGTIARIDHRRVWSASLYLGLDHGDVKLSLRRPSFTEAPMANADPLIRLSDSIWPLMLEIGSVLDGLDLSKLTFGRLQIPGWEIGPQTMPDRVRRALGSVARSLAPWPGLSITPTMHKQHAIRSGLLMGGR